MKTSVIDLGLQPSNLELTQALAIAFSQVEPSLVIINTTGSSGVNKKVELSTEAISKSAELANAAVGAKLGDIWSLLLPTNHIAGLNVLARAIKLGTEVVGVEARADFTAIVPTQLHRALTGDHKLLEHLQNCKAVLVGGAAVEDSLLEAANSKGITLFTTYGMTETSGGCVYNNVALPGVLVELTDSGLIKIKGPTLASGYQDQEALWLKNFLDGWFITRDLGEIKDGKIFVVGRADDVIISGGENISLAAIESELARNFPEVNFLATSVPDKEWGQKLCLLSDTNIDQVKISSVLQNKFGRASVPKEFLVVKEIPLIGIGKPDRVKASALIINAQR
jgi:O-succinylbenzoic acid--CoA ligase